MSREFSFFIYLLERYAEHLGVTADVAYRRLLDKNLVDYAVGMYELYHVEAIENAFADLDRRLSAETTISNRKLRMKGTKTSQ